ncbi:MAG: CBS domain-containing protein [Chloroflexi bacterium]|nr:CBS domain-containing protein [Chloroflexota bacterium]
MLVKEIMHIPVVTIQPDDTLRQAAERMVEYGVNGLPVIDAQGYVIGIIGLKDILRAPFPSLVQSRVSRQTRPEEILRHLDVTRVERVMATMVWSVREDDEVMKAVVVMVNEGLHPLPVLREGRMIGIISRADAVRAILSSDSDTANE